MSMVSLTINGTGISVPKGTTILKAAKTAGINIPTLCFHERLNPIGACRICVADIEGFSHPVATCTTPVSDGISVQTESERLSRIRRDSLSLILSNHALDCPICDKAGECLLQDLVYDFGMECVSYPAPSSEQDPQYATELIRYWPARCILCLRCVSACREIKGIGALAISADNNKHVLKIDKESCVSCGECLKVCPTGALTENVSRYKGRPWLTNKVLTTCTYCGCGCQLELNVLQNRITGVTTRDDIGINRGSLCAKGRFGYEFINSAERLTKPLIKHNGSFREATWNEALDYVADRFTAIKEESGPNAIAGLASARSTNEENYIFQKFMRMVIGTNNVDHCSRLCHISTVAGLSAMFGSGAMTNPINDVLKSEVILTTGTNTTENHPIFSNYIIESVMKQGAKLIVVDPRRIRLVDFAHIWLRPRPGTDVVWINGFIHIIIKENLLDLDYIYKHTDGFNEVKKCVEKYTPEYVSDITGIPVNDLYSAARLYGHAKPASILYSMGITQHTHGTDNVKSLGNLAMLCGNIGVEGGGVNPLRGQNNVQGACDLGALPNVLTGYQQVADEAVLAKFMSAWDLDILPSHPGLTVTEMFSAAETGSVKAIYIVGENPMMSFPDVQHLWGCINELDFLVVQDIFMTETAELADVVLPAASFAEKDGTFTNSERKVQRVRKALNPPFDARDDLWIVTELANRLGSPMMYDNAQSVFDEIRATTTSYAGITYDRIDHQGVAWPCPTEGHPGTPVLHANQFRHGKGKFFAIDYRPPIEIPDDTFPYLLSTGRIQQHFHTGTMTRRGKSLNLLNPEPYAEINSCDAESLGLQHGDFIIIASRRGKIKLKAWITDRPDRGVIFVPIHFREAAVNKLTNWVLDPIAKIPEYKVCAVQLEKV